MIDNIPHLRPWILHTARAGCLLAAAALTPACGDSSSSTNSGSSTDSEGGYYEESSAGYSGSDPSGAGTGGLTGSASDGDGDGSGGGSGDSSGSTGEPIDPGQLTAGEWRDLDNWDFWRALLDVESWKLLEEQWRFFTAQRYAVVVQEGDVPIADARVTLVDDADAVVWEARTDNRGRAELFAGLFDDAASARHDIKVSSGDASATIEDAETYSGDPLVVDLEGAAQPPARLDLMFVVDTTGSMGDELSYLQAELADVIATVEAEVGQELDLRLSVNFYRDDGDEYVVRSFPFTNDIDAALDDLAAQSSDGGGDFPEAVEVALDDAIEGHAWSDAARARLLFFVLDAPPHHTESIVASLHDSAQAAARKGVRVIPVAGSGIDKATEFLMRFVDIATGGTYVFLTSHSGIGGEHIEPTIGEYEVELLNDLLVRLIGEALA